MKQWDKNKILKYLNDTKDYYRKLFFILTRSTWVRVGDAINIKVRDLFDNNLNVKERFIITEMKTGKRKNVLITKKFKKAIEEYKDTCIDTKTIKQEHYIFHVHYTRDKTDKRTSHISRQRVWKEFKRWKESLNLEIEVLSPHSIRKGSATELYQKWVWIEKIQLFLNHSKESITRNYAQLDYQDLDSILEELDH